MQNISFLEREARLKLSLRLTDERVTLMPAREFIKKRLRDLGQNQQWLAQQVGMSGSALSLAINGKRDISIREAENISKALELPILTVLQELGIQTAGQTVYLKLGGIVRDGGDIYPARGTDLKGRLIPMTVAAPPGFVGGDAYYIDTDELRPRYHRYETIFTETGSTGAPDSVPDICLGAECIVFTHDGRKLLRILQPGTQPRLYHLVSFTNRVEPDVLVRWASPIAWHKPARGI